MRTRIQPKSFSQLAWNAFAVVLIVTALFTLSRLPVPSNASGSRPRNLAGPTTVSPIKTVFLIMMENTNWTGGTGALKGSNNAPYINRTLLPMSSYANQYFTPPGNHPSLPNYLWLEAGTNFGILDDKLPSAHHLSSTSHLVTLLNNAGLTWKGYLEDISGTVCPLTSTKHYTPHHNAMVYFDDVTTSGNPNSAFCIAHERPYTELAGDLQNNGVANFNYIIPNLCHDMHGATGCNVGNIVKAGDSWLSKLIPQILASQAYQNGGAIFVSWDEGHNDSDGPIGMMVVSQYAKGGGYSNMIHYTHSSTLATLEEIFDVTPLLGNAANAPDLSDLFLPGAFPSPTPTPTPTPTPSPTPTLIPSPTPTPSPILP